MPTFPWKRRATNLLGSARNVVGPAVWVMATAPALMAQSILIGNFLPNPDMETETRFEGHRTEGPTDNSFADYWHHSQYSGWNDLTPPEGQPAEPVLSGIHSLRLFDQESYYFAPDIELGSGEFAQEEFRTFATEIPLDPSSPTGRAEKLWFRWHWNYDMTSGSDPSVTMNIRISEAPVVSLDLVGASINNPTIVSGSSNGAWEEVTFEYEVFPGEQSFDMIVLTEGTKDAIGIVFVDDVSVSAINPNSNADFNSSTHVDGADFLVWQRGLGLGGQTNNGNGDATGDGVVNVNDFIVWEAQFGGPAPSVGIAAVPEPAAWSLWAIGLGASTRLGRRRFAATSDDGR